MGVGMPESDAAPSDVRHKTVSISYRRIKADIDVEIVPLIRELWRLGIRTNFCCQGEGGLEVGGPGSAYIQFADSPSAEYFEHVVYNYATHIPKMWALMGKLLECLHPFSREWSASSYGGRIYLNVHFQSARIPQLAGLFAAERAAVAARRLRERKRGGVRRLTRR